MGITFISRAESSLRPPRHRHTIAIPTAELWLHHSAGALDANGNGVWWDDVRGIQNFHMDDRGWSDIAYNFLVGGGQVFEGRGFGVAGGHTQGHNTISHAICLIGNYEFMHPTPEDLRAIADIAREGRERGAWGEITGDHSAASGASTACAGRHLRSAIPEIRRLAATATVPPPPDPTHPPTTEETDMLIARADKGDRIALTPAGSFHFPPRLVKAKRRADLTLTEEGWDALVAKLGTKLVRVS